MHNKAQIEGFDIILSVFIFLLLFAFVSLLWQSIFLGSVRERQLERLKIMAVGVSDQLVLTQGSPAGWQNASDYNKVGLVSDYRKISASKLNAFKNADYNSIKTKLNFEGKEYFVSIVRDKNTVFTKGILPSTDFSVKVDRIVVYQNSPALLSVIVHG